MDTHFFTHTHFSGKSESQSPILGVLHPHTYTHTHTHIRVKVIKWGDHPVFLHLDTLGPNFFNLAFLIIYDRQFLTEWRSYQQRNKFCVEICTVRKMLTDVQKFTKENFEVYKI